MEAGTVEVMEVMAAAEMGPEIAQLATARVAILEPMGLRAIKQSDAAAAAQSDPTNDSLTDPAAVAIDNPAQSLRGPGGGGDIIRAAIGPFDSPGTTVPTIGVDTTINAVMVSGASTPWEAIGKSAGVRNVIINGGIIALGENPLANGTVGPVNSPPSWLKFKPNLRYLRQSLPVIGPAIAAVLRIIYCRGQVRYLASPNTARRTYSSSIKTN